MDTTRSARARIVVGVDGSPPSKRALLWAAHLAELENRELDAIIVRNPPTAVGYPWSYLAAGTDPHAAAADELAAAVHDALGCAPERVHLRAVTGAPAAQLLACSRHAAYLVVGSRGRGGFANLLLGSVGMKCVEQSSRPVLVVHNSSPPERAGERHAYARVVVGVDGSAASRVALRYAARYAERTGAHLEVCMTWEPPELFGVRFGYIPSGWTPQEEMDKQLADVVDEEFGPERPADLRLFAEEGDPASTLLRRSRNAALLVLGSRGRSGLANLALGSVTAKCAEHARSAVLIVHATGPGTPTRRDPTTEEDAP